METGLPVSSTTIVCGFAAATCAINSSCPDGSDRLGESCPSDSQRYAKTIATSALFAVATAEFGSLPSLYTTCAFGALSMIAFIGEVGNQSGFPQIVSRCPGGMI